MKSVYSMFKTDKEAEKNGIIVDYGEMGRFKIARIGGANSAFARMMKAKIKRYKYQIDTDTLPEEVDAQISTEVFVKCVLLGWEGVTDEDGNEILYTEENALKMMSDLPDLRKDLSAVAQDYTNFLAHEAETAAKNSASTSDGN